MNDYDRRNKWRDKQNEEYFEKEKIRALEYCKEPFGYLTKRAGAVNNGVKARGVNVGPGNRINGGNLLNLIKKQGGNPLVCNCAMCTVQIEDWEIDHIFPIKDGGSNTKDNLQILCKDCHKIKTDHERKFRSLVERRKRRFITTLTWDQDIGVDK